MTTPFSPHRVRAITMWDFSWLERRWPGAGYEDWDEALDGLLERGYDAVRIDAYPHLLARDPYREYEILPCWNQQDWGAPALVKVRVLPALVEFLAACRKRGIAVGLSTWFREDRDAARQAIATPRAHAAIWRRTLDLLAEAQVLDAIAYVDLCNEWPLDCWAPFFPAPGGDQRWHSPASLTWMREACTELRAAHPGIPLTFSVVNDIPDVTDLGFLDLLEPHIWLVQNGRFYERTGYSYQRFDGAGYQAQVRWAEAMYRSDSAWWLEQLRARIHAYAQWSKATGLTMATTECWGPIDWKDWPGLDWGWVKEACAVGTETAAATGRWRMIATSNFCGPQFRGMWRDVAWHRRLTDIIKASGAQAGTR